MLHMHKTRQHKNSLSGLITNKEIPKKFTDERIIEREFRLFIVYVPLFP